MGLGICFATGQGRTEADVWKLQLTVQFLHPGSNPLEPLIVTNGQQEGRLYSCLGSKYYDLSTDVNVTLLSAPDWGGPETFGQHEISKHILKSFWEPGIRLPCFFKKNVFNVKYHLCWSFTLWWRFVLLSNSIKSKKKSYAGDYRKAGSFRFLAEGKGTNQPWPRSQKSLTEL